MNRLIIEMIDNLFPETKKDENNFFSFTYWHDFFDQFFRIINPSLYEIGEEGYDNHFDEEFYCENCYDDDGSNVEITLEEESDVSEKESLTGEENLNDSVERLSTDIIEEFNSDESSYERVE